MQCANIIYTSISKFGVSKLVIEKLIKNQCKKKKYIYLVTLCLKEEKISAIGGFITFQTHLDISSDIPPGNLTS